MIREAMKEHMVRLFVLTGYGAEESRDKMERIWAIETAIAEPYYSMEKQRDSDANYHKVTVDSLTAICGGFDWRTSSQREPKA